VTFDLAARTAVADLTLRAPPNGVVVLETGDLSLTGFEDADGVPVEYLPGRGRVTIATAGEAALSWRIRYGFQAATSSPVTARRRTASGFRPT
jgi:hypothetical protein